MRVSLLGKLGATRDDFDRPLIRSTTLMYQLPDHPRWGLYEQYASLPDW